MRRPVFAANWKMNLGPTDARAYLRKFLARYKKRSDRAVVFFPSAASIPVVVAALSRRKDVVVGVQNIATEANGAFTGETSAAIARDAGARLALVGHSERRHVFGETDDATARKCALAVAGGLTPVLCVGETLNQREAGRTQETVVRQLLAGLGQLSADQVAKVLIAYEPVWAVGTGRNATPRDASSVNRALRAELARLCGDRQAAGIPILYGGSVTTSNARSLLDAADVDGLLVGGASLDPLTWSTIVNT